ncbi:4'-phosphopantetheinyl transferase family protein [Cognatilysobacter bugurensis]|uniref:4'-phosphopantetheinyl transferase n=1 Tax=Cognatilysobacter bugurensis TaxID=543356 RepID=A0A918T7D0_9GAMM|nr:4'-phosphopantetheinyl transferase superfamily protein [Lysobacter bugurensis]GHA88220.1 4'-phosphopantetheinyl transferase [Lysobacter bugurensis]
MPAIGDLPVAAAVLEHRAPAAAEPVAREWLAQALGVAPAGIGLDRDARGRPQLSGHGTRDCNWSHSGERLLVGLAPAGRIGVDLERLRPRPRALELARRFFCAAEADALAALPADAREAAFVRLWCAKEAVLKAHGHGLSFGLHRLEFALDPGPRLVACDAALGDPTHWAIRMWTPDPGYLAALAWRPW